MENDFNIFAKLFARVDAEILDFTSDYSERVIYEITPVLATCVPLMLIVLAYLIITQKIDYPLREFMRHGTVVMLGILLITTVGNYQRYIGEVVLETPDALAAALSSDYKGIKTAGSFIDEQAQKSLRVTAEAWQHAGIMGDGLTMALFAVLSLLATAVIFGIGGGFIVLAKVALAVLVALGPLFIAFGIFPPTRPYFKAWVNQIMTYGFLILLMSAIFSLIIKIYASYTGSIQLSKTADMPASLAGCVMFSLAAVIILLQVPNIAAALGGGAGLSASRQLGQMGNASSYAGSKAAQGSRAVTVAAQQIARAVQRAFKK